MSLPKNIYHRIKKIYMKKLKENCNPTMSINEIRKQATEIDISNEMNVAIQKNAIKLSERILKISDKILNQENQLTIEFLINQRNKWGEAFNLYELYYILSLKFAARYCQRCNHVSKDEEKEHVYEFIVIKELHGRACQIYAEILCLIKNGYADGAYARWRTLYEIMIIISFIKSQGKEAAKAFYDNSFIDTQHCNWAKGLKCFKGKNNISFKMIETKCNFNEKWMQEYKNACKTVHASPEGTFGRISNKKEGLNIIPVGRCDYGINIPATHSCITLSIINAEFMTIFSHFNTLVELQTLMELKNTVVNSFKNAEKEIFNKESEIKITTINPRLT